MTCLIFLFFPSADPGNQGRFSTNPKDHPKRALRSGGRWQCLNKQPNLWALWPTAQLFSRETWGKGFWDGPKLAPNWGRLKTPAGEKRNGPWGRFQLPSPFPLLFSDDSSGKFLSTSPDRSSVMRTADWGPKFLGKCKKWGKRKVHS